MKYSIQMGPGAMIYISSFINIDSGIQKLIRGGGIHRHKQYGNCINLLLFFLNKESRHKKRSFLHILIVLWDRDSSVGTATGYGLDGQDSIHSVRTGSGAHTTFYPMGTGADFPGDKATWA
jgi:hypothetical protein